MKWDGGKYNKMVKRKTTKKQLKNLTRGRKKLKKRKTSINPKKQIKTKRKASKKQLENLAKGREKLLLNQLKKIGIDVNLYKKKKGKNQIKKKRKASKKQLENLAKGREKLLLNQLKKRGIKINNPNQINQKKIETITDNKEKQITNLKDQLSIFEKFLVTNIFPIEINKNKEHLSIKQIVHYLFSKLIEDRNAIISHQNTISKIIGYMENKDRQYKENIKEMSEIILDLKKEIIHLKKKR
jgi:hypothetical protein